MTRFPNHLVEKEAFNVAKMRPFLGTKLYFSQDSYYKLSKIIENLAETDSKRAIKARK